MPYLAYCELTDKLTEPYTVEEDTNIAFWYAYEDFFLPLGIIKELNN